MIPGLVSTIIPVYNRPAQLREAVDSVLQQDYPSIEIIIVDDGSTDDTPAAANELATQNPGRVQVLTQPNSGPGYARQAGVETARGEFVQFLDSDDLLIPDKFLLQVSGLRQDVEAGIAYGKTYTCVNGVRLAAPAQRSGEVHREIFPAFLAGRIWETATPLYRATSLRKIGPWSSKRQMEDWEFDAKAGAAAIKLHYCDAFVSEYRVHGGPSLAHAWLGSQSAMRDRLNVYAEILKYAHQAGVKNDAPEMQRYARTLFWAARSGGQRGLTAEARYLSALAQGISKGSPVRAFEIALYRGLADTFGWTAMGRLSHALDALRGDSALRN